MTLKRTIKLLKEYLKMNNLNVTELTAMAKPSSSERANKYRLDEINTIKEYFDNEIKERKDIIKRLNKYLVSFDIYLDRIFTLSSASFGTLITRYSFIRCSSKYTSWYCRFFLDFNIYNRYWYK